MPLAPGEVVDRYVVEILLGAGGMADVYGVRHGELGSRAALKVLRGRSSQLSARLLREGRVQARLRHPNVVPILDLVDVRGAPGLVMERVDGPTLAQLVAGGPMPIERVERLTRGLMAGLHAPPAPSSAWSWSSPGLRRTRCSTGRSPAPRLRTKAS